MDDDDEFGDFGGFEAADPSFPVVDEIQPNVEAGPSPWAILDTAGRSQVGMRPDLLCVQNQFPPVLDPTVPQQQSNGEVEGSQQPLSPPSGFLAALDIQDNSAASIVNDILDGSFNRGSEPSSLKDLSSSNVPVQAADSRNTDNAVATDSHTFHIQAKEREAEKQPTTIPRLSNSVPEEERNGFQAFQSKNSSAAEDANQNAIGGGLIVVEVPQIPDTENIVVPPVISLNTQQKPGEQQLDMKQVQADSANAVKSVVQEYKVLMQSSLQNHEETVNNLLQKNNKERQLQLDLAIAEQKKDVEASMQEMRVILKEEIEKITQESLQKFQSEMQELLEKEKKGIHDEMEDSLQTEKDGISRLVQEAVVAERERGAKELKDQKDEFLHLIEEERKESRIQTQSLLEEQKKMFQETLKEHLEKERKSHRESMDRVIELANQEMRTYLQQQREMSRHQHQRQYASLDVFLNGARQQLQLLMENDSELSSDQDSGREKSTSQDKDSSKDT
ncbi:uncharacterized protein LOC111111773 [Crassostrea virginica]